MEDNSMDNNDQLKAVLIKKLEEIKINDQEDSKSIMWKLPEIAAVALVFIAIVTVFRSVEQPKITRNIQA